jgi:hypothetical protein
MVRQNNHSSPDPVDPVASSAALLRRIGFMILMIVIPVLALLSRRAVVVLMPVAVVLIIIAALIDGAQRPLGRVNRSFAASPPVLATLVLVLWIFLSLIWTPYPEPALSRAMSILATAALGLAGYYLLPDRMRASNLYLVPIGVALTAVVAALTAFGMTTGVITAVDPATLERGLIILVMAVWPAVAWLSSRGRDAQALAVAGAVGIVALVGPGPLPLIAFATGAVIVVLTTGFPRAVTHVLTVAAPVLIVAAPFAPFLAAPFGAGVPGGMLDALGVWRHLILDEPMLLITGHGLETALRARVTGELSWNAPNSLLFEIWYELGLVGAVSLAIALAGAVRAAGRRHPALVPGGMGAFASAFTLGLFGVATTQMWWLTALIVIALIFVCVARGQYRTKRPRVLVPGLQRDPLDS